jgi:hypothetical protein
MVIPMAGVHDPGCPVCSTFVSADSGIIAVAALSMMLGIGANTAIFSVMDAMIFAKLPISKPDELVVVRVQDPWHNTPNYSVPYQMIDRADDLKTFFSGVAAAMNVDRSNVTIHPKGPRDGSTRVDPLTTRFSMVSGNYFATLGINAAVGRVLTQMTTAYPARIR